MTGTPLVKNDTLFLKNVTIEVHSNNIILKYATAQFGQKLVSAIQEKAFFPLKPTIDQLTDQLKKQFPIKWGSACILLDLEKITLKQGYPQSTPKAGI